MYQVGEAYIGLLIADRRRYWESPRIFKFDTSTIDHLRM